MRAVFFVAALALGFFSVDSAVACGFSCSPSSCLSYGRTSLGDDNGEVCANGRVDHLDPQNWTEENFRILADELSGYNVPIVVGDWEYHQTTDKCAQDGSQQEITPPASRRPQAVAAQPEARDLYFDSTPPENGETDVKKMKAFVAKFDALPQTARETEGAKYVQAILLFRSKDYVKAAEIFETLTKSKDTELAMYSLYFEGRAHLGAAGVNWDGYTGEASNASSEQSQRNTAEFEKAASAFTEFSRRFPEDLWAASAVGLIRRAKYFAGDIDGYMTLLASAIDHELGKHERDHGCLVAVFAEASRVSPTTLLHATKMHPIMWLVRSYLATRDYPATAVGFANQNKKAEPWKNTTPEKELKALEQDKDSFKKYKDLYAWSRAVLLLKQGKAEEGYKALQSQSVAKTNVSSLSWVALNARLLMAMSRFDDARKLVHAHIDKGLLKGKGFGSNDEPSLIRKFLSSANDFLASTYLTEGKSGELYLTKTDVQLTVDQLKRFAESGLSANELAILLKDKDLRTDLRPLVETIAIDKFLLTQDFEGFLHAWPDVQVTKSKKEVLAKAVATHIKNPKDAGAFYEIGTELAHADGADDYLGTCKDHVLQRQDFTSPLTYFTESLELFKTQKAKDPREAALLKEMLQCYRQTTMPPRCFYGQAKPEYPLRERAAWFKRLHTRYANSPEAKSTKNYW